MKIKALPSCLILVSVLLLSCMEDGSKSNSPYDQSYIEFKLSPDSALSYDDILSLKVYADPYQAFNMKGFYDEGRSVLGAYDYKEDTDIYLGFEYDEDYICRLEGLRMSITRPGSQEFVDSAEYSISFQGALPADASEKPYISFALTEDSLTLTAVQGSGEAPVLNLIP